LILQDGGWGLSLPTIKGTKLFFCLDGGNYWVRRQSELLALILDKMVEHQLTRWLGERTKKMKDELLNLN
jgi:hypothetical protein